MLHEGVRTVTGWEGTKTVMMNAWAIDSGFALTLVGLCTGRLYAIDSVRVSTLVRRFR